MSWWGPAALEAYTTSDQALSVGSWSALNWHSRYGSSFDALFSHTAGDSKLYVKRPGTYLFLYRINTLIADPQSDTILARMGLNGTTYFAASHAHCGVGTTYHERGVSGHIIYALDAGDYIELEAQAIVGPNTGTAYASGTDTMGRSSLLIQEVHGATIVEAEIDFTSRAGDPNVERGLVGQAVISDASPERIRQAAATATATATITSADPERVRQAAASISGLTTVNAAGPRILFSAAASVTAAGAIRVARARRRRQVDSSINGSGLISDAGDIRYRRASVSANGAASAAATAKKYAKATASITATATAVGESILVVYASASGTLTLGTEAQGVLSAALAFPPIPRTFSGRASEASPVSLVSVGVKGDPSVNNLLTITGVNDLIVSGSYSGPDYWFQDPPSASALGVKRGDRVLLVGAGPNGGRELTVDSPGVSMGSLSVMEDLIDPGTDTTEYQFYVFRRIL